MCVLAGTMFHVLHFLSCMIRVCRLDSKRGHDAQLIQLVNAYLESEDTKGLDVRVLDPVSAIDFTCERIRRGLDTISATGLCFLLSYNR